MLECERENKQTKANGTNRAGMLPVGSRWVRSREAGGVTARVLASALVGE